jgi:hypothetical protein
MSIEKDLMGKRMLVLPAYNTVTSTFILAL